MDKPDNRAFQGTAGDGGTVECQIAANTHIPGVYSGRKAIFLSISITPSFNRPTVPYSP